MKTPQERGWLLLTKSVSSINRRIKMLETFAIILVILWILGLATSFTLGGFLHALLVIAIVILLIRVIQGRLI